MATHSNVLAWEIPWTEEPGRLQSVWGYKEADTTEKLNNNKMVLTDYLVTSPHFMAKRTKALGAHYQLLAVLGEYGDPDV